MRYSRLFVPLLLLFLAACQNQSPLPTDPNNPPPSTAPTLALTPTSININAGGEAVIFSALVQNSSETVSWSLSGPGSVTPASGPSTVYTPPESVDSAQGASLTATLGTTGATATAPIAIYPASVTPPDEPPPAQPPSNPPTNPPPPTDPPTNPPPTDPPPPDPPGSGDNDLEVKINGPSPRPAVVDAATSLQASVENAVGTVTYAWTKVSGPAAEAEASFADPAAQNTEVTFGEEGTYRIRLSATDSSGDSDSDDVTFEVTAATTNTAPTVDIQGEVSQTATTEMPKTLEAVATDPENDTLTYQWNVNTGDANGVVFSSPNAATTTVTFPTAGYRSIRVTVTDQDALCEQQKQKRQIRRIDLRQDAHPHRHLRVPVGGTHQQLRVSSPAGVKPVDDRYVWKIHRTDEETNRATPRQRPLPPTSTPRTPPEILEDVRARRS